MGEWFNGIGGILSALIEGDSWGISQAMQATGVWPLGLVAVLLGGTIMMLVYRAVPLLERHLEPTVMVVSYLTIGGIIFVEVFRRFVLNEQAPWSTTLPPFLFLIMTWVGCSYNVKLRTHLAFAEFRTAMPRPLQMACLTLDAVLWLGFCWVVFVTSTKVVANSAANFQFMLGTDNLMQWWFLISVPISFTLLAARAIENLLRDLRTYGTDAPLIEQAVIGGE